MFHRNLPSIRGSQDMARFSFPSPGCGRTSTPLPIVDKMFFQPTPARTSTPLPHDVVPDTTYTVNDAPDSTESLTHENSLDHTENICESTRIPLVADNLSCINLATNSICDAYKHSFDIEEKRTSTPLPRSCSIENITDPNLCSENESTIRNIIDISSIQNANNNSPFSTPLTITMVYPQCSTPNRKKIKPSVVYTNTITSHIRQTKIEASKEDDTTPVSNDSAYGSASITPTVPHDSESDNTIFMDSPMCKRAVTSAKKSITTTVTRKASESVERTKKRLIVHKMRKFSRQFQGKCSNSELQTLAVL